MATVSDVLDGNAAPHKERGLEGVAWCPGQSLERLSGCRVVKRANAL